MPWIVVGVVIVALILLERSGLSSGPFGAPSWRPTTRPQPAPASPGVVPTAPGPAGSLIVVAQPGDMGTLNAQSGPSGQSINFQTPSGYFLSMTSTNANVIGVVPIDPSGHTAGVTLGSAIFPGTAVLNAIWQDGSGTQRSTRFTVVAS